MLEGFYLTGLPIDLNKFGIGIIHQMKYRELIEKQVELEYLLKPFMIRKEMLLGEDDELNKIINSLGNLGCLYNYNENSKDELSIVDNLLYSLKIFYATDDVCVNPITKYIHVNQNNKEFILDEKNFDILGDVVLEMYKIDKPKFEKKQVEVMDEGDLEFERKRNAHKKKLEERNKKAKENSNEVKFNIHDIVNQIIHTNEFGIDYEKVLNMTIYQIKNTQETLVAKNNFEHYMNCKLNQFDVSKMHCVDWRSKKIVKNSEITI